MPQRRALPLNRVHEGSFLTLHYRLSGPDGTDVVSTFGARPATLSVGAGQLAAAIEARLVGLEEGAQRVFELAPGEAFGERHPDKLQRVARSLLSGAGDSDARHEVGDVVSLPSPDGAGGFAGLVREVGDDWLLLDFNHPLAGQAVRFEVQLIGVL